MIRIALDGFGWGMADAAPKPDLDLDLDLDLRINENKSFRFCWEGRSTLLGGKKYQNSHNSLIIKIVLNRNSLLDRSLDSHEITHEAHKTLSM